MQAKHIVRHSIVKQKGKLYVIENESNPILLIPAYGGIGIELSKKDTDLEVIKFPAQLAMEYLNRESIKQ